MSFEKGDHVAHPHHGAGVIKDIIQLAMDGEERAYYRIDLVSSGTQLMVPLQEADGIGLRPALDDVQAIYRLLESSPTDLDDNYTIRQAEITDRLRSGDPLQWASALCDLTWRARDHELTKKDADLRSELLSLLANEVALVTDASPEQVAHHLETILERVVDQAP